VFKHYIESKEITDLDSLADCMLTEQFLNMMPVETKQFITSRQPNDSEETSSPTCLMKCHVIGVPPKKNLAAQKIKISDFAIWSRISPDGNKISSIWKRTWKPPTRVPNLVTLVHKRKKKDSGFDPLSQLSHPDDHISYLRGITL